MIYDEKLSTRLTAEVARRLRLYVALRDLNLTAAINTALDQQLPTLRELVTEAEAFVPSPQTCHKASNRETE